MDDENSFLLQSNFFTQLIKVFLRVPSAGSSSIHLLRPPLLTSLL